jgi:hypothetical protein
MTYIIAIFRSRTQAVECSQRLRALNIPAKLISTPKSANVGCGLSVEFAQNYSTRVKNIIARGNYSAFYGYLTANEP